MRGTNGKVHEVGPDGTYSHLELEDLRPKEVRYVFARSVGHTIVDSARYAGLTDNAVYNWDYRARVEELAREMAIEAAEKARQVLEVSVVEAALRDAQEIHNEDPNVGLRASQDVLDRVLGKAKVRQEVAVEGLKEYKEILEAMHDDE